MPRLLVRVAGHWQPRIVTFQAARARLAPVLHRRPGKDRARMIIMIMLWVSLRLRQSRLFLPLSHWQRRIERASAYLRACRTRRDPIALGRIIGWAVGPVQLGRRCGAR